MQKPPARRNHRRVSLAMLAFVASSLCALPRPAQAQVAESAEVVAQVVTYIKKAYDAYKQISALFGPKAKSIAAQLAEIKQEILGELRTQRNQRWRADAQTVMDKFGILANRPANYAGNAKMRDDAAGLAISTINQYAIIVEDMASGVTDDLDSSYQLSPLFNALLTTYMGLTKMKGEIDGDPATWHEYNVVLQPGMRVNYKLIGSQTNICFSTNPGAGAYNFLGTYFGVFSAEKRADAIGLPIYNAYAKSPLWKERIGNKYVAVDITPEVRATVNPTGWPCNGKRQQTIDAATSKCNPALGKCQTTAEYLACYGYSTATSPEMLIQARDKLAVSFSKDPMVKIARAGMEGLLAVGGGRTGKDESSTALPAKGQYVDPSISKCTGGFATYPTDP